jgi:ABC-type glycerol-3-phosphate transport system substrate-binding protein
MKRLHWLLITLVVVFGLLLVACGGEEAAENAADADVAETTEETAEETAQEETAEETAAEEVAVEEEGEPVTLRVLIHQNPPMVEFMEAFNDKFEAQYPNVTVDMSVVNANDLSTVTQTRLTANDVDVIDIFGFANAVQPYMASLTAACLSMKTCLRSTVWPSPRPGANWSRPVKPLWKLAPPA